MRFAILLTILVASTGGPALAQNSRLFDRPLPMPIRQLGPGMNNPGMNGAALSGAGAVGSPGSMFGPTVDNASWITVPTPPAREIRKYDMVTIRIDIAQRTIQDGNLQRRKNATLNAQLKDWIVFEGLSQLKPAPQSEGDEKIQGTLNKQDRTSAQLAATESLKMEVGAQIVSVLPNGNVVLEAHRHVANNEEKWLVSLSGVCSKNAIGPGNLILSKDIADLQIKKEELGSIKDSYKRGWLQRGWDLLKAF